MNPNDMNQEELNDDLKQSRKAERENKQTIQSQTMKDIMEPIENKRKELREAEIEIVISEEPDKYTQKWTAEKAGITVSSYKRYIWGECIDIKLIPFLNLITVLRLDASEVINFIYKNVI